MNPIEQAYLGKPALKKKIVAVIRQHHKADEIIHGTYWKSGKGCAVGCSVDAINRALKTRHEHDSHGASEAIGIPQSLYRLQDSIFEGLANGHAKDFPLAFASAIRPGADLSKVTAKFLVWFLLDKKHGAILHAPKDKFADCHNAILAAAAVWQTYIKTGKVDASAAWSAESAARSAAWSAESAAESAASAAGGAESAESAESAARLQFWKAAAATMINLLKKA